MLCSAPSKRAMKHVNGDGDSHIKRLIITFFSLIKNAIQLDEDLLRGDQVIQMTKLADQISWLIEDLGNDCLKKMKELADEIGNRLNDRQREPLGNDCLKIMEDEIKLLRILTVNGPKWPHPCLYCLRRLVNSVGRMYCLDEVENSVDRYIITSRAMGKYGIENVIQLDDRDRHLLETLALNFSNQFQHWQRLTPTLNQQLVNMEFKVRWARLLIQLEDKLRWAKLLNMKDKVRWARLFKPKLSGEIYEWNTDVNNLFKELQELQTDLVETGIKHGEVVIEGWLREDPEVRIIGVCGGAGVGKTTLLQNVYNTYKVSDIFDVVIWVTVAQLGISEVRDCIARALNLDLGVHHSNSQMGKHVKLFEYLKTKKFLLIFDNMWNPLDLKKLGVEFGDDKGSKLICSSRKSAVTEVMMAKKILYVQPMTREEAWELFRNIAFKDLHLPEGLKHIARQVADQCKGSPIALNVIAATMKGDTSVDEWNLALRQMQTPIDHKFPSFELEFDEDLYQILRWSYERLPDANFKSCFMYCVMFPRDEEIEVDKLVGMWTAEDLVESMDLTNLIDAAYSYLKLLVDRCFFQVTRIPHGRVFLKTHNTLLDVAIYIGRREKHCLILKDFNNFPVDSKGNIRRGNDWKRLSFYGSSIKYLPPNGLKCTKLASLCLGANTELDYIPMLFLDCLSSIRVLDLSRTKLKSLPITLWQLIELRYLDLSYTQIEYLSEDIGRLSKLQFLNLSGCSNLISLPKAITHLFGLQSLNACGCTKLTSIPSEIYEIKSLKSIQISQMSCNFMM